jgi:hypothetical protein
MTLVSPWEKLIEFLFLMFNDYVKVKTHEMMNRTNSIL